MLYIIYCDVNRTHTVLECTPSDYSIIEPLAKSINVLKFYLGFSRSKTTLLNIDMVIFYYFIDLFLTRL